MRHINLSNLYFVALTVEPWQLSVYRIKLISKNLGDFPKKLHKPRNIQNYHFFAIFPFSFSHKRGLDDILLSMNEPFHKRWQTYKIPWSNCYWSSTLRHIFPPRNIILHMLTCFQLHRRLWNYLTLIHHVTSHRFSYGLWNTGAY